ncbi:MAG: SUMF1/EgtB/PvdO family nonheme iron enzyme [Chthoniobacterales bacterium]|nr:SUMF1/EgtB/PvdO family nonheme iron enzyme [Chthoniobacterales bacterium]
MSSTSPVLDVQPKPSLEFPDDPLKWEGWSKYKADNLYERLCLDPRAKPGDEQIQQHCTALLQWWQKKVRLKNQPNTPMTQLLGRGIDEAPQHLVQARMQLLDPARRREVDDELAAHAQQETLAEFSKYVAFSLARRVLTAEAEANLSEFGQRNGLTEEQTRACIEEELKRHKAKRVAPAPTPAPEAALGTEATAEAEKEFKYILRLSKLDLGDATLLVRRVFVTIAESMGINFERGEHLLEEYLDQAEFGSATPAPSIRDPRAHPPVPHAVQPAPAKPTPTAPAIPPVQPGMSSAAPARSPAEFVSPTGAAMVLIPAGEFVMGSDAHDAAPNEQPLTPVTLSEFYMSRHPVTNAEYEQFDPSHKRKRLSGAGPNHPVVYVSSLEALKYCQWLGQKDGKTYRLPTEAEWEYAARGADGRKYPWGNQEHRGDFANFADASTTFPWRDPKLHDGYPETSPIGAFPLGASVFGLEDMAGNVWEWCLDFYHPLPGVPKRNPRFGSVGAARVYRGGSWKSRFTNLRTKARSSDAANFASTDVGFRVACANDLIE